jgi:mRNA-degrading endonuclease RelE of RelBE toxin-antitoxin system
MTSWPSCSASEDRVDARGPALADDPYPEPPEGFHRGRYHRLRSGAYRIMYVVDEDVITIERVDQLTVK